MAVDEEEHDFGIMDVDDKGSHDFVVRNTGEGLLTLSPGETSCRCTGRLERSPSRHPTATWSADRAVHCTSDTRPVRRARWAWEPRVVWS